jgi:hypothetical protein
MPRLSREFPAIHAFADEVRQHPFSFKPFEPLDEQQVRNVLLHAELAIMPYRAAVFDDRTPDPEPAKIGWMRRIGRAVFSRKTSERTMP